MDGEYELILKHLRFPIDKKIIDKNLSVNDEDIIYTNNLSDGACFDIEYYREKYLKDDDIDPIEHYLTIGVENGCNPNKDFDGDFYLKMYPVVKLKKYNPFIHFIIWGLYEGRLPKKLTLKEALNQNLKKSLKGKNDYLFLINDSNSELRQHFDNEYISPFSLEKSKKVQKIKKDYCNNLGIPFYSFGVPDKSIICTEYLPFSFDKIKRTLEERDDIIDLKCDELNHTHYSKLDTHTNYKGGKLLAFQILKHIDSSFTRKYYENMFRYANMIEYELSHDLATYGNWSYSFAEFTRLRHIIDSSKDMSFQPKNLKNVSSEIPKEFATVNRSKSIWFKNPDSYSDLKALILCDSTMIYLRNYLSFYFKDMFLYWDHGTFNRDIIDWYEPDIILEVRIERFLGGLPTPDWIEDILSKIE